MSIATETLERLSPSVLDPGQVVALDWLRENGWPEGAELWRYTRTRDIVAHLEQATPALPQPATPALVDSLIGEASGPRVLVVNGHPAGLIDNGVLTEAVSTDRLDSTEEGTSLLLAGGLQVTVRHLESTEEFPEDAFDALNRLVGSAVIEVSTLPGAQVERPLEVVHLAVPANGEATTCHPRTVVSLAADTELQITEFYAGVEGSPVLTNSVTNLDVAAGARLDHQRIQIEPTGDLHLGRTEFDIHAGATVESNSITLGASLARHTLDARLLEPDATVELRGLYQPTGEQRHDTMVTVDHIASSGTSNQDFRGVIDDRGQGSFSGRIVVRPGTVRTDAHQNNHNLVLNPRGEADSRPWLEIFADDVACTHGSTVGRLDEEALFYLRSRGIPTPMARAILVDAFAHQITDRCQPEALRERIGDWISHDISEAT